jgi:hypothetical protein
MIDPALGQAIFAGAMSQNVNERYKIEGSTAPDVW